MTPNRIAVYLTALAGLAGAIAVPIANLDTQSTAGVIAGVAAVTTAAATWLLGWQKHEARIADDGLGTHQLAPAADPATIEPDVGDAGALGGTGNVSVA